MKHRIKALLIIFGCIVVLAALLMPHIFIGLRSWSLEYAVERGDAHTVAILLSSGANPNLPDDGFPPLMQSLQRRHDDVTYLLLSKGANINAVGPFGTTPLLCVDMSNIQLVSYLVQHGANVNAQNDAGTTALMIAASDLHNKAVHLLLAKGARPNAQDKNGQTPLMQAITSDYSQNQPVQQAETIKELLNSGSDTTIVDAHRRDALTLAKKSGRPYVLRLVTGSKHKTIQ